MSVKRCKICPKYRVKLRFITLSYTSLHFSTLFYIVFTLSIFARVFRNITRQTMGDKEHKIPEKVNSIVIKYRESIKLVN